LRRLAGWSLATGIAIGAAGLSDGLQAAPQDATFEVASVKPSREDTSNPMAMVPRLTPPSGGRLSAANIPLRMLIQMAFQVQPFQIVGGPDAILAKRFDINARAEDGFTGGTNEMMPLVRTLLVDRFELKTHKETRELPISTLVVARSDGRLGPELKPSTADCPDPLAGQQKMMETMSKEGPAGLMALMQNPPPCSMMPMMPGRGTGPMTMGLRGNGQSLVVLVNLLTQATGRIVTDNTGLTGLYDFTLTFDPQVFMAMSSQLGINLPPGASLPASDAPALLTAIQEQLGLKLVNDRGPVEVVVIDSVAMPTPD
jgi:uncharacterized protein (TIGR03435 family)